MKKYEIQASGQTLAQQIKAAIAAYEEELK